LKPRCGGRVEPAFAIEFILVLKKIGMASEMQVRISIEGLSSFEADIDDSDSKTIRKLQEALPIDGKVMRWGDEIYFFVGFKASLERGARSAMKVGEIAYWPNGPALAIFFGPTPASEGEEPAAASDCNVIGRTDASPEILRRAREGAKIIIDAKR
jgi:hypothetical protein